MNNRAWAGRAWSHAASVGLNESHPVHAGSHKQTVKNGSAVISLLGSRTGWRPAVVSKPGETRLRQRRLSCDHCVCLLVSACVCQAQVWAITDMCVTLSECGRGTCSVWMFRLFDLRPRAPHTCKPHLGLCLYRWITPKHAQFHPDVKKKERKKKKLYFVQRKCRLFKIFELWRFF